MVEQPRRAVFQLAHAFVEQIDQILDAIGHRRVDGDRRAGLMWTSVVSPGPHNRVVEYEFLRLLLARGTSANEHPSRFLKIEQPKRQP